MSDPTAIINPGSLQPWQQWEWLNLFHEAFNKRWQAAFGCQYFPPVLGGDPGYPLKLVGGVVNNNDDSLTFGFSDVDWSSGEWTGSNHTAGCAGSPLHYNLVVWGDLGPPADPYQQVSGFVTAQTQDNTAHTGTLTISPASTFLNAITAKFIPSLSYLAGKSYALVQTGYPTFLDRRWTRPNSQEAWIGQFSAGWDATLNYVSGTETFNTTGSAPYFPITVPFVAVSSSHKLVGTLILNTDGSFGGVEILYASDGGMNTASLFDHTIWNGVSFALCKPTYDPATGIGQLWQPIDIDSPSPYDNLPTDPPQPPHTKRKKDQFKGMDLCAFSNAGGLDKAFPDPASYPLSLGYDYTSAPTVTPTGGGGSGAAVTAVLGTSTAVIYILMTNVGGGYTSSPSVSISGSGGFASASSSIDGMGRVSITLVLSSTGFTSEPTVTIDAPPMGGTQAVARAILGVNTVDHYNVTNPGTAYTSSPTLGISGGGGSGAVAVCTLNGSSKLLINGVVAGNDENIFYLGKRPSDSSYALPSAPLTLDAGQQFIILATGTKGMPGRHGDPVLRFYAGALDNRVGHLWDNSLGLVGKAAPSIRLQTLDDIGNCSFFNFNAMDLDVLFPADECNCGKWNLPVNVGFWKTWRALQVAALFLLSVYIDPSSLGLSTRPKYYDPTPFLNNLKRVWRRRFSRMYPKTCWQNDLDDDGDLVYPPVVDPGGKLPDPMSISLASSPSNGALTHNTSFAYRVSYYNSSGETLATPEQTITTTNTPTPDTYSITIGWAFQVGAQGAKVYGRTASGEQLLATVAMPTLFWVDDGSVTPSGALPTSNTTSNDCNGVGQWVKRLPSTNYLERDPFGYAGDSGPAFVPGDYAMYMAHNPGDPFPGGDRVTVYTTVEDRFFQGVLPKQQKLDRHASQKGTVTYGTKYWIIDTAKNWWTDETNIGTSRVQGMVAASGGATTFVVNSITGDGTCWWDISKYVNLPGPFGEMTLEIYPGGAPAGWTFSADGTATYSTPTAPGHTGSSGITPTISAVIPGAGLTLIHAIGASQTLYIDGDHFDPVATVSLTNTATGEIFTLPGTVTANGEITISLNVGFEPATWTVVVTNPGPHASTPFSFIVTAVYYVPVTNGAYSSGTGTLTFTAVSGLSVSSGDAGLIRWPAYELNKWQQRMVKWTKPDNSTFTIPVRFSANRMLFFSPQSVAFAAGWTYEILEYEPSVVLKFSASAPTDGRRYVESVPGSIYWAEPYILDTSGKIVAGSNTDSRGGGDFLLDLTRNLPTKVTGTGLWMVGDDFSADIPNQIWDLLQLMKSTANFNPVCRNIPAIGSDPEDNGLIYDASSEPINIYGPPPIVPDGVFFFANINDAFGGFQNYVAGDWDGSRTGEVNYITGAVDNQCPFAQLFLLASSPPITNPGNYANGSLSDGLCLRFYAYPEDSNIPMCQSCTVTFWAYAVIPGGDPDEGISSPFPSQQVSHFDNQGTSLEWRKYTAVSTAAPDGNGNAFGTKIGNASTELPIFTQPDDPQPHNGGTTNATSSINSGYVVTDIVAVRTWSF